ncbi:NADH-cytochrome b5 reductase-like [Plodia interpunctella]|uniref:NADH-cytochrome b5 reductase-like n=1 Tax=Plodia interpunctella TaxID=58824 RepID=UPI0023674379|nr:NADH-cytochrome b5 reductase-like [Plodia interpunctella]
MKPPLEPSKEDCCNSGCNPCIFDVYEKQLALYNKYLESGELPGDPQKNAISQTKYTNFIVIENLHISESHRLLKFRNKLGGNEKVFWKPGDHFLVKFSSESISCSRAYTPIKLKCNEDNFDFLVVVKKYENGLVSKYLFNLKLGEDTLWRGPYGSYDMNPNKFKRIFMIAQGTGIAPFISIIEEILNNEDDFTKLFLYYSCRSLEDVLFRDCLYSFKSFWNFSYTIFLKVPTDNDGFKYQEPIRNYKLNNNDFASIRPFNVDDQFLVCGSTKFMESYRDWLLVTENFQGDIKLF